MSAQQDGTASPGSHAATGKATTVRVVGWVFIMAFSLAALGFLSSLCSESHIGRDVRAATFCSELWRQHIKCEELCDDYRDDVSHFARSGGTPGDILTAHDIQPLRAPWRWIRSALYTALGPGVVGWPAYLSTAIQDEQTMETSWARGWGVIFAVLVVLLLLDRLGVFSSVVRLGKGVLAMRRTAMAVLFASIVCVFGVIVMLAARSCALAQYRGVTGRTSISYSSSAYEMVQSYQTTYLLIGAAVFIVGLVGIMVILLQRHAE